MESFHFVYGIFHALTNQVLKLQKMDPVIKGYFDIVGGNLPKKWEIPNN